MTSVQIIAYIEVSCDEHFFQKNTDVGMLARGDDSSWPFPMPLTHINMLPTMHGLFSDMDNKLDTLSMCLTEYVSIY